MKVISPKVSIIIPTRNRVDSLLETLDSIYKMSYPRAKIEVLAVDNGSKSDYGRSLKRRFPATKIIKLATNVGFGPALNIGIKQALGEYILVTNDDVIFDKDCLRELINVAELGSKIGIVGGKMYFKDDPTRLALPGFKVNLWLGYHPYDFSGSNSIREMDVTTGGCMLIRASMFKRTGPFDEGFFFCGEDYDLCLRAKKAGFKVMFSPKAVVWHEFLNNGKKTNNSSQLFSHYRGKFRFMVVHATVPQMLVFFPIQLLAGPIFCYWQSRQLTFKPMINALGWNLMNIKGTAKSRQFVNQLSRLNRS